MRVGCVADLHGHLPQVPDGLDMLVIAGDVGPHPAKAYAFQCRWFDGPLRRWLGPIAARCPVVVIAGNHDWVWQERPDLVPDDLPWTYLRDSGATIAGLRVWGSPWQPRFCDWAFNLDEPDLEERWSLIPDGTDVLVVHGPPYGIGDLSPYGRRHVGSSSLLRRIEAVAPRLVVCGHIHLGRGVYRVGETVVVNAAMLDEDYRPVGEAIVVEMSAKTPR